jgi:hypothetical protein
MSKLEIKSDDLDACSKSTKKACEPLVASQLLNKKVLKTEESTEDEDQLAERRQENLLERFTSKSEQLYNKICSKVYKTSSNEKSVVERFGSIQYGNLVNNFNPKNSISCLNKSAEDAEQRDDDTENQQQLSRELISFLSKRLCKESVHRNLNLVRKSSLINLIERNRVNAIFCPFDEFAYSRLITPSNQRLTGGGEQFKDTELEIYLYDVNKINTLMPNCCSSFLITFFFDIFKASELQQQFTSNTLDILLKLKSLYVPKLYLDDAFGFSVENTLWNCFALFKFKFDLKYRYGFINFLVSMHSLLEHFRVNKSISEPTGLVTINQARYEKLKRMLPYYADALELSGLLNNDDLAKMKSYYLSAQDGSLSYVGNLLESLNGILNRNRPQKLRNMCRIFIKNRIRNFTFQVVESLDIKASDKEFLLFNQEFERCWYENKDLF